MDFRLIDRDMVHPSLLRFADYWRDLAHGDEMPPRSAFRIGDAHWLYGFLAAAEVMNGGSDYRYSYAGDFWKAMLSYDLTATRLSELEAVGRLTNIRPNYDAAVRAHAPRYRAARLTWRDGRSLRYVRLVMPFAGDDGQVAMLVIAAHCGLSFQQLLDYRGSGEPRLALEFTPPAAVAA